MFLRLILCGCSNPVQSTTGGHEPCQHKMALQASVMGLAEHTDLEGHITVRHEFTGGMQKVKPLLQYTKLRMLTGITCQCFSGHGCPAALDISVIHPSA